MYYLFLQMFSWPLSAVLVVILFSFLSSVSVFFIRRVINQKSLKGHHDVAAVVFANLGVLYSVLLGFTVVNVQQRFDKIKSDTEIEASYLAELYRDAEVFEEIDRNKIRDALKKYSYNVIYFEWPHMSELSNSDVKSQTLSDIWDAFYSLDLKTSKQKLWYTVSINKLNQLMSARLSRLLGSRESLGAEMWTMLILGAVILNVFICFFGLDHLVSHLMMASFLGGSTGFLLYLIYSLDTAFTGNISIPSEAMQSVLASFKT